MTIALVVLQREERYRSEIQSYHKHEMRGEYNHEVPHRIWLPSWSELEVPAASALLPRT